MTVIGDLFEAGDYFLRELILAGEMLGQITDLAKPKLASQAEERHLGKIIFGTVEGDIHDLGKDIVVFMLKVNGFDVYDLGVDVPPREFVRNLKEIGARILGLSGLLTLAFDAMKATVEALEADGLREDVKVMIGGGPINEQASRYTGADAWGPDAMAAVRLAKEWARISDD